MAIIYNYYRFIDKVDSECVQITGTKLNLYSDMIEWCTEHAGGRIHHIPNLFSIRDREYEEFENKWASGGGVDTMTIWIQNKQKRIEFKLTWL